VDDTDVCEVVQRMRRRRGGDDRLLAYRNGRTWHTVQATDVNDYLAGIFKGEVTAKDFRTWHATVIAAIALASNPSPGETKTARRKVIREAVAEVADYLGNTPAVARGSYVDPRVLDLYEDGTTIARALQRAPRHPQRRQLHLEKAVLRMLSRAPSSAQRSNRRKRAA
ncbi:MAG: DNA topoisomerase IB, partial [Nocardioidaceae bacterium]